jgi:hypothetical protein
MAYPKTTVVLQAHHTWPVAGHVLLIHQGCESLSRAQGLQDTPAASATVVKHSREKTGKPTCTVAVSSPDSRKTLRPRACSADTVSDASGRSTSLNPSPPSSTSPTATYTCSHSTTHTCLSVCWQFASNFEGVRMPTLCLRAWLLLMADHVKKHSTAE